MGSGTGGSESLNRIIAGLSRMCVHALAPHYFHSSIAHLYHAPPSLHPAGYQAGPPPLPWASAGPADCSALLRAINPSSLILLQLSSPLSIGEQSYRHLAAQPQQQPPSPAVRTLVLACMHVLPSSPPPLLARRPDLPLPSISPRSLSSRPPRSCCLSTCFKVEFCSRLRFAQWHGKCWSPGKAGGSGDGTLEMNNAAPIDCRCCVNTTFPGKASSSLFLQGFPTLV